MPTLPELGLILFVVLGVYCVHRVPAIGDALGRFADRMLRRTGSPRR